MFVAQGCCQQAELNVKFLSILKEPCRELAQLKPSEVAPKVKHIISLIRIIWDNNHNYSTSDRITRLFQMVPAFQQMGVMGTNIKMSLGSRDVFFFFQSEV